MEKSSPTFEARLDIASSCLAYSVFVVIIYLLRLMHTKYYNALSSYLRNLNIAKPTNGYIFDMLLVVQIVTWRHTLLRF
jgi:hypothetical protein